MFKLKNSDGSMNTPTADELTNKCHAVRVMDRGPERAGEFMMRVGTAAIQAGVASAARRAYIYDDLEEIERDFSKGGSL